MAIDYTGRVNIGTLNRQIKLLSEPIFRDRVLLALLKEYGRIAYNVAGKGTKWRVRYKRREPIPNDDLMPGTPVITQPYKEATLQDRSYIMMEQISKGERLANKGGPEALIKIISRVLPEMMEDMAEGFASKLYTNGNLAANSDQLHGLESWFETNATPAVTAGTSCAVAAEGTYAGIYKNLGYYAGTWTPSSGDGWPTGTASTSGYDFYHPLIVDYGNTNWSVATATWVANCREAISYAIMYLQKLQSTKLDVILLSPEMMLEFKHTFVGKETVEINQNKPLAKLGFSTIECEGVSVTSEYGVPDAVGYGLSMKNIELWSKQSQLFAVEKDREITTSSDILRVDFWGNMKTRSPAYQCKFIDI